MSAWGLFDGNRLLDRVEADDALAAVVAFATQKEYGHLLEPLRDQHGDAVGATTKKSSIRVEKL